MFATLAVAALLAAPAGFHESPKLERVVQYVAHNATPVYCANTIDDLNAQLAEEHSATDAVGFTQWEPTEIFLHPVVCQVDLARMAQKPVGSALLQADDALTLVHEAVHATGIHDEGRTECDAMHLLPGVAVRFLHVKPGKQLRAFMAQAWKAHRLKPAAYQAVC